MKEYDLHFSKAGRILSKTDRVFMQTGVGKGFYDPLFAATNGKKKENAGQDPPGSVVAIRRGQ